jgi:hypothetical protein
MRNKEVFFSSNFDMKDLGEDSYVLGIEIHRDRKNGVLGLSQKAYLEKVLIKYKGSFGIQAFISELWNSF